MNDRNIAVWGQEEVETEEPPIHIRRAAERRFKELVGRAPDSLRELLEVLTGKDTNWMK